jgi:hypothetical protein
MGEGMREGVRGGEWRWMGGGVKRQEGSGGFGWRRREVVRLVLELELGLRLGVTVRVGVRVDSPALFQLRGRDDRALVHLRSRPLAKLTPRHDARGGG